ncbi:energy transducer TonB [Chryseobacterium sp. Mn2064]|uniref:energy transducer TonB n=1 Tax=Chryseobacterium sp. Mn2064 TaxID=3395263 RepID=UPI003BE9BFB5
MKKITLFLSMLCFESAFSQKTLAQYPDGQSPYKGGTVKMASDIQDYFLKSGAKPCDKDEMYFVALKIDENGKPSLVKKKSDDSRIEKNKCAFNLAVKSLGNLKDWQPAEENGEKVIAYYDFPFFPQDFFQNYRSDYDLSKLYQYPMLTGGMSELRKEIKKELENYQDTESYKAKGKFIISFIIDPEGAISDVDIEPKVENSDRFFEDIKSAIKKIKPKWSPAKIKGKPVSTKFRMPFNFATRNLD